MQNKRDYYKDSIIGIGILIVTMSVYILTMAPTVHFGDSGELTVAAYDLGIAHPPGYPLYLLLGKLFMLIIPIGDMAFRMNLMSVCFAAITAVLIYGIMRLLLRGFIIPVLTTVSAVFTTTFWSQAVVTEVYTMAAAFLCLLIFLTVLWDRLRSRPILWALAASAGFAMTHHVIIALFFPVILIYILVKQRNLIKEPKLILTCVVCFILPLLLYFYLPIRSAANPLHDWGNPETFSAVIDHVTGFQFRGHFFKYGLAGMTRSLGRFFTILGDQIPIYLFLFPAIGIISAIRKNKPVALLLASMMVINVLYSSAYDIDDINAYYIPAFLIMMMFGGYGMIYLYHLTRRFNIKIAGYAVMGVLIIAALMPVMNNWSMSNQRGNYLARNYGRNILNSVEQDGVLFIDWEEELFILSYLMIVEGMRPDVTLYDCKQNIYPIPVAATKRKKDLTIADVNNHQIACIYKYLLPVYFTNKSLDNFTYHSYGLLYRALRPGEHAYDLPDPWEHYDLTDVTTDVTYSDPASRFIIAKYYLKNAGYFAGQGSAGFADTYIDKAIMVAGDQHLVLKLAGIHYLELKMFDKAEYYIAGALELDSFSVDCYNMQGMIAHYRMKPDKALYYYNKVLMLDGNNIPVLMNRARLYEILGDEMTDSSAKYDYYTKALADLEHALKIEPANKEILHHGVRIKRKL